jgi:hypothetical protein
MSWLKDGADNSREMNIPAKIKMCFMGEGIGSGSDKEKLGKSTPLDH